MVELGLWSLLIGQCRGGGVKLITASDNDVSLGNTPSHFSRVWLVGGVVQLLWVGSETQWRPRCYL